MSYNPNIDQPIRAAVFIHDFVRKMVKKPGGSMEERHFVIYSPNHPEHIHLAKTTAWIEDLRPEPDSEDMPSRARDAHSAIGTMARVRWEAIEPAYNAWLAGQSMQVDGIPMRDWMRTLGMEAGEINQKANLFGGHNIHSVEQFVASPESMIIGLSPRMPDVRFLLQKAQLFLKAKSQADAAEAIAAKDEALNEVKGENEVLRGELDEVKSMLARLLEAAEAKGEDEAPKRRGRPRAAEAETAGEAAA